MVLKGAGLKASYFILGAGSEQDTAAIRWGLQHFYETVTGRQKALSFTLLRCWIDEEGLHRPLGVSVHLPPERRCTCVCVFSGHPHLHS